VGRNRAGRRWSALGPAAIALTAAAVIIVQVSPLVPQTPLVASNYSGFETFGRNPQNRWHDHLSSEDAAVENGRQDMRLWRDRATRGAVDGEAVDGRHLLLYAEIEDRSLAERSKERLFDSNGSLDGTRGLVRHPKDRMVDQLTTTPDDRPQKEENGPPARQSVTLQEATGTTALGAIPLDQPAEQKMMKQFKAQTPAPGDDSGVDFSAPSQQPQEGQVSEALKRPGLEKRLQIESLVAQDSDGIVTWERKTLGDNAEGQPPVSFGFSDLDLNSDAYGVLVAPVAASHDFVEITPLPESVARTRAECDGRYSELLAKISAPADVLRYGRFHDAGLSNVAAVLGRTTLPAGYRVYVAPDWYIWARGGRAGDQEDRSIPAR
jgi:hypothetical protein